MEAGVRRPAPALQQGGAVVAEPAAGRDLPRPGRRPARRTRPAPWPGGRAARAAGLCAPRLPGGRGSPVLQPPRGRLRRRGPGGLGRRRRPPRGAGRLDHHPAGGPQHLPQRRPDPEAQAAGGGAGLAHRTDDVQGRDPGAVSQPHLLRRRRLWGGGGVGDLFRQAGAQSYSERGGGAGGPAQGALAAGPGQRPRCGPGARPHHPDRDAPGRLDHRG